MSAAPTHASATSRARSERNAVGRVTLGAYEDGTRITVAVARDGCGSIPCGLGRLRIGVRIAAQAVADSAHRLDALDTEGAIDLRAQVAHVHVDDVRRAVVREVPHVVEDLAAAEHLARVPHQELEEGELLRRE